MNQYIVPAQLNFPYNWKDYSFRPTPAPPPDMLHGFGQWGVSPIAGAVNMLRKPAGMRGYGEDPAPPSLVPPSPIQTPVAGAVIGVAALVLGIYGLASFYAGKAMAPSPGVKSKWGWYGVVGGLLGGPIGLGVVGAASLSARNDF